jgi:thioredoxin reductase (NADPH)
LRRKYGKNYRIVRAQSGSAALSTLEHLKRRGTAIALLLVDQRMPQMSGVEFLERAINTFPDAKRVLLTAYADTEAAIYAINKIRLDYYLTKPWDPPDLHLYPVLDDLLDAWQASFYPPFEGIRVIGHRWSPLTHQVKDFMARNRIPYRWVDVEAEAEGEASAEAARLLERAAVSSTGTYHEQLPAVLFPDGTHLSQPTNAQIAEKLGHRQQASLPFYDLVIVGGGPAGLAAAVYASSDGLHTLLVEREGPGGQAGTSSRIENYLGFPSGLSGWDLARRAVAQATRFGTEILTPQEVVSLRVEDPENSRNPYRIVTLATGEEITCHALVIATGVSYRKLSVPGMDRLLGAGVYYGAAQSEAIFYKGEDVFLVGGANSAGQAAMYFSMYTHSVTMIVRGDSLSALMSQYLVEQIQATPNIRVMPNCGVVEAHGDSRLEAIAIANSATSETVTLPANYLFIFIGAQPRTEWLAGAVERDAKGFILTGPDLIQDGKPPKGWPLRRAPYWVEASVPGVFAVGDVRYHSSKRVATAVGEGAMAVQFAHRHLSRL